MKLKHKYYVGAAHIAQLIADGKSEEGYLEDINEATKRAEANCTLKGEPQIVVKVIKIITRRPPPVKTESIT